MTSWPEALIGLLLGGVVGAALTWAICTIRRRRSDVDSAQVAARVALLQEQIDDAEQEAEAHRVELEHVRTRAEAAEVHVARLGEQLKNNEQQAQQFEEARQRLLDTFKAAGAEVLKANSQQFLQLAATSFQGLLGEARGEVEKKRQAIETLVQPIKEMLEKQNKTLSDIETKRAADKSGLVEQFRAITAAHEKLGTETGRLVSALRRPEQRGRWGEMQLRNVVELAGMTRHCDFVEQPSTRSEDGVSRPDMIVRLPGGGVIVVDAKVALDAYLDSIEPDADRTSLLGRHERQVAQHAKALSSKRYWDQFERTPKIVVMFMPLEAALVAALEVNPDLHADAMKNNVLLATPTLLVALLRATAFGWQQEDVAANAREIASVGRELYDRLAKFVENFEKVGQNLERASRSYNAALGSLEARLLPSARDLKHLHVTTEREIRQPPRLNVDVRPISAGELKPVSEEATPAS